MTKTEIPAVGNLITFVHPRTWRDTPGEVVEVRDETYPDLGGTDRRHVSLFALDRLTRKVVHISISNVISDLGPLGR